MLEDTKTINITFNDDRDCNSIDVDIQFKVSIPVEPNYFKDNKEIKDYIKEVSEEINEILEEYIEEVKEDLEV